MRQNKLHYDPAERRMTEALSQEKIKQYLPKILVEFLLLIFLAFIMIPFLWIFSTSLRLPRDSFALPPAIFPTSFRWQNYGEVFETVPFLGFILNSIKITVVSVCFQVIASSTAAYAFARIKFPGNRVVFVIILSGLMIPAQVTIIPLFIMISKVRLLDTHIAVILPSIVFPLGVFLLRQFMMTIPRSYEEAAYMDGAGRGRTFFSIILPMVAPSVIVVSVVHFIAIWNELFRPLIFLNSYQKMTLPLGLRVLNGFMGSGNMAAVLAGITLSLIPPLLFYIFGQRYLLEGARIGGIKA